MIKKISAVVLALVLCLSVIVVPASALDLGSASVAFELKWDKEYYSAGETAYLQVFMKASESLELATGSILIATNSAQITQDTTHVDAVGSDLWNSFWKEPASSQGAWQSATITDKVNAANNATEQALYDQYLKIVVARNTGGSHDNAGNNKQGLPGADINALADAGKPIITFAFVVGDVADGTELNAAISTGSLTCSPAQTAFKYIKTPGTATTTASVAATAFDVSAAVAEATVGTPAPTVTINKVKSQIRFNGLETGDKGSANFDIRTLASVSKADLAAVLDVDVAEIEATAKGNDALRVGFVYKATSNGDFDIEKAEAAAEAGDGTQTSDGYIVKDVTYVQRSGDNYAWSCLITYTNEAMYNNGVNAYAYIIYDGEAYFMAEPTPITFKTLYDDYYDDYVEKQNS